MFDASAFINPRTPGYAQAFIDNSSEAVGVIFDSPYAGNGGIDSFQPFVTCSESVAKQIKKHSLIEIAGREKLRAASNPQLDGTGLAYVVLEEFYE